MTTPRFIVIEGPSGVGKTTLARNLAAAFHAPVYDCEVRLMYVKPNIVQYEGKSKLAQALLYLTAIQEVQDEVERHIDNGNHVIMDRHLLSTYVHQIRHLPTPDAFAFSQISQSNEFVPPNMVIYLDADHEVLNTRLMGRHRIPQIQETLHQIQLAYRASWGHYTHSNITGHHSFRIDTTYANAEEVLTVAKIQLRQQFTEFATI